jgi:hypothetical protein
MVLLFVGSLNPRHTEDGAIRGLLGQGGDPLVRLEKGMSSSMFRDLLVNCIVRQTVDLYQ